MEEIRAIYCDFDGTITKSDAVNTFFELYTGDKQLNDYIENIEIDQTFLDFIKYIKEKNIKFTILSDGFDMFIYKTLERLNLKDIPVFANHLVYENNKFKIEFPHHNPNCDKKAGMCKCDKVKESKFCYIGDGTSDLCIASKADVLFATKNLHKYCEKNVIKHHYFETFSSIIEMLEKGV